MKSNPVFYIKISALNTLLEICAGSISSALAAEEGGANRIELCAALSVGGLTPGFGTIKEAKRLLSIPVHVLIRPREGDFCYSNNEIAVICEDIYAAKDLGADGIVCGALDRNGDVDESAMKRILKASYGVPFTFHRAFDVCTNPFATLDLLIEMGINTLLTSGQAVTAEEGIELIKELVLVARPEGVTIMPGCGLHSLNIARVVQATGVNAVHLSAKKRVTDHFQTDPQEVRDCKSAIESII